MLNPRVVLKFARNNHVQWPWVWTIFFESLILCVCICFPSSLELQGLSYRLQKLLILTKLQIWQQSILERKNLDLSNSFKHVFCHLDHPVLSHSCLKRVTLCPTACRKFRLVSTEYWEFCHYIFYSRDENNASTSGHPADVDSVA